jgi:hypothetical protein
VLQVAVHPSVDAERSRFEVDFIGHNEYDENVAEGE